MIASIFKKSKPINFVIILSFLFLIIFLTSINQFDNTFSLNSVIKLIIAFAISSFTIFLINFIVVKNKLIEQNSYHILFYALFLFYFPNTMLDVNLLLSNVFVLLALRRIISLRSQIDVKKKLFDSAIWISIASLFYFWAILFLLLIFAALILFSDNRIKNWIIPFAGVSTVLMIIFGYNLLKFDDLERLISYLPRFNWDFSNYNSMQIVIASTLTLSFGIWATIFYVKKINAQLKVFKPSHKIIIAMVIIALGVLILSEDKNSSEFIFLFAPLSIIITNYIETIEEKWFKEIFIYILVLAPFVLLML